MTQESLSIDAIETPGSRTLHGHHVRRIMAQKDLTLAQVAAATSLDERTVRSILRGKTRPHARTLHKLAAGLEVEVDDLFQGPRDPQAAFNRLTNPAVRQLMDQRPELFRRWKDADFEELFSRVAVGGELTEEGAAAAAEAMNRRRELITKVAVILETAEAELLREFVALLYRRVTTRRD